VNSKGEYRKKKVFFIIGKLEGGGAERVVIRLLRYLDRERFTPLLVMFEKEGVLLEDVPADVKILDCGRRRGGGSILWFGNLVGFFRREKPDVALSFMWFTNAVTLFSRFLSRVPIRVVVSERFSVLGSREAFVAEVSRRISIWLLYGFAERIICNSEAMKRQFVDNFHFPESRVAAIYNPVDIAEILRRAGERETDWDLPEDLPVVVGMGRLSPQKGYDLLIRAAEKVRVPFLLLLLGEGKEEGRLRGLAERLGIGGRVVFAGFRRNPYPYLRGASVFVLPSRYEGFPNALVEAMALGLPCVATRCPTGPEEIVTHGEDGLLVPVEDPEGIAQGIDLLLKDASLCKRLGTAAAERVMEFDVTRIVRKFEDLLEEVAS
jgi:glycosyltransferase involved in cell wall biosynthesis